MIDRWSVRPKYPFAYLHLILCKGLFRDNGEIMINASEDRRALTDDSLNKCQVSVIFQNKEMSINAHTTFISRPRPFSCMSRCAKKNEEFYAKGINEEKCFSKR